jgi:hypothetical protein
VKGYCNKCHKLIPVLNELEKEELKQEGSFVCSDCINDEMDKEHKSKSKKKVPTKKPHKK